jgi:hypothetical protein
MFLERGYKQQLRVLPESYFTLLAIEEVLKSIFYFFKTGVRLNSKILARCSDSAMPGHNINVGLFSLNNELVINSSPADLPSPNIGIAVSHKIAYYSF